MDSFWTTEVIFFFLGSLARQNTMARLHILHSVIWKAVSAPLNRAEDLRLKAWDLADKVLVQEKNNCQHVSAEKAAPNRENVEQTCSFAVTCL